MYLYARGIDFSSFYDFYICSRNWFQSVFFFSLLLTIYKVRENRADNHEWTIQRCWQHWAHKTQDEEKYMLPFAWVWYHRFRLHSVAINLYFPQWSFIFDHFYSTFIYTYIFDRIHWDVLKEKQISKNSERVSSLRCSTGYCYRIIFICFTTRKDNFLKQKYTVCFGHPSKGQHIFFFVLCLVCPMLSTSLDCPFVIVRSVLSDFIYQLDFA
jgi:hypothetical protein